jgi:hypothetical protein
MGKVRHTDIEGADAKLFGAKLSFPMKTHCGPSTAQLHDLHLAPGDAVDTGTEGFADGFFGGKAGGEAIDLPTTLLYFSLSENALEEAFAVVFVDLAYSIHLNNIDAYCDVDSLRR